MATDANLTLQASVTKTATFNGAWLSIPTGTPRRGMKVRVIYSAATQASGSGVITFAVDVSPDNGTTVYANEFAAVDSAITLSTTAQAGEIYIPIETSQPYIRLSEVVTGTPTTGTITYQGDIELGRNH